MLPWCDDYVSGDIVVTMSRARLCRVKPWSERRSLSDVGLLVAVFNFSRHSQNAFQNILSAFRPVIGSADILSSFARITGLDWRLASRTDRHGVDGNLLVAKSHLQDDAKTISTFVSSKVRLFAARTVLPDIVRDET